MAKPIVSLWSHRLMRGERYKKLVVNDQMIIQIKAEVYDHGGAPFVGFSRAARTTSVNGHSADSNTAVAALLGDVKEFCETNPAQTIQISCNGATFSACRFLLQARSKKFRVLLSDRERNWQHLELKDVESSILEQMLMFVHLNTCDFLTDAAVEDADLLKLLTAACAYHCSVRFQPSRLQFVVESR